MGASGWGHLIEHTDVAEALQVLRQRVYDSGEYYREPPPFDGPLPTAEAYRAELDASGTSSDLAEFLVDELEAVRRRPPVTGPDSLLANQPESGTHSIIDMAGGVSDEPQPFTVSPLTPEELDRRFGTQRPSVEAVIAWVHDPDDEPSRRRWVGTYVVAYSEGRPSHIAFAGCSGD